MQAISTKRAVSQVRVFAPGLVQERHRDDRSRISVVLRGRVAEESDWGAAQLSPGDILFKSREVYHEDRFSREGASIFSVLFDGGQDCPFHISRHEGAWRIRRDGPALRASFALLEAAAARHAEGFEAALSDLINSAPPLVTRRTPPTWLLQLYAELETHSLAEVDVAARARSAGFHPVTASREFRRSFGMSITEHALVHCVRRAVALLSREDLDLTAIATEAGFYDQSHMNRVFRRVLGRAPGAYRRTVASPVATTQ